MFYAVAYWDTTADFRKTVLRKSPSVLSVLRKLVSIMDTASNLASESHQSAFRCRPIRHAVS